MKKLMRSAELYFFTETSSRGELASRANESARCVKIKFSDFPFVKMRAAPCLKRWDKRMRSFGGRRARPDAGCALEKRVMEYLLI
jgi:hypothetical protein